MPGFVSPGGAASQALEQFILNQQAEQHQNRVDQLAAQRIGVEVEREKRMRAAYELESKQAQEALEEKRREYDATLTEKKKAAHEKSISGMMIGDIPSPEVLAADDKFGGGNFPLNPDTGVRTYRGTVAERQKAKVETQVNEIIKRLPTLEPGSADYIRAATQYEMLTGKTLPASATKPAAAPKQPVRLLLDPRILKGNPYRNAATLQPATPDEINDPNVKIDRLQDTPPKDTTSADNARLDRVHESAIKELDTWAKPIEGNLAGVRDVGQLLNQQSPEADKLIAPLILKATVSGQGSGFRMTQSEIKNVMDIGRWNTLKSTLQQWSLDPSKALSITPDQRKQMRDLVRAIRDKATRLSRVITDARHTIDDATDAQTINRARTKVQEELNTMDEEDPMPSHESASAMVDNVLKRIGAGRK